MTGLYSRILRVDKRFQPLPQEEGDEFYPNGIFEFNITKLLKFIKANPLIFRPEAIFVKSITRYASKRLNELTIETANLGEPIILAEIAPDKFNVIDGNHRLERAYREGVSQISAYKVRAEQHIIFLTSVKAYEHYVGYWNLKIQEQCEWLIKKAI